MRLTQTHLQYWLSKHTPPGLRHLQGQSAYKPPSIHACINSHADWKPVHENTIHLLRLHRSTAIKVGHGPALLSYLMELGDVKGWCFTHAQRRSAWARSWARRIAKAQGPEAYEEIARRLAYSESVAQYRAGKPATAYAPRMTAPKDDPCAT